MTLNQSLFDSQGLGVATAIHLPRRIFLRRALLTASVCLSVLTLSALSAYRTGQTGPILMFLGAIILSVWVAYCLVMINRTGVIISNSKNILIRRFIMPPARIDWRGVLGFIPDGNYRSLIYVPYLGSPSQKIHIPLLEDNGDRILMDLFLYHTQKTIPENNSHDATNAISIPKSELDKMQMTIMPNHIGFADFSFTAMTIFTCFITIAGLSGHLRPGSTLPSLILVPFALLFTFICISSWLDHWRDPGGFEWLFDAEGIRLRFYGTSNIVQWSWSDIEYLKLVQKDGKSNSIIPDLEIYVRGRLPAILRPRSPDELFQVESVCQHYRPDLKLNFAHK